MTTTTTTTEGDLPTPPCVDESWGRRLVLRGRHRLPMLLSTMGEYDDDDDDDDDDDERP
jgi:hypothetical protein